MEDLTESIIKFNTNTAKEIEEIPEEYYKEKGEIYKEIKNTKDSQIEERNRERTNCEPGRNHGC